MLNRLSAVLSALLSALLLTVGTLGACSDDPGDPACTPELEGETWDDGPQCCGGGCGVGTDGFLPVICKGGQWVCQGDGVPAEACASYKNACNTMDGCHIYGPLGETEEPDPVPELCCFPSCTGTKAMKRVCKSGTLWECPGGAVPISRCKDYENACGGILAKYKANGYKLP
jgi:hypothetical protein